MANLINIRFNDARILPCICDFDVEPNSKVVVDCDGILEFGTALYKTKEEVENVINKVLRIATLQDIEQNKQVLSNIEEDKKKVSERVNIAKLEMKLVTVLRSFDSKKILIMYTADDRVDFRMLVRDLAGIFRMRVEMRQISERDEARYLGGCGICGQPICCRRFLIQPKQTSIKMAKVQGQSLTPTKINGACGKLMCCLQYEFAHYSEVLSKMPTICSKVVAPEKGEGVVAYNDVLSEMVAVRFPDQTILKYNLEDLQIISIAEVEDE